MVPVVCGVSLAGAAAAAVCSQLANTPACLAGFSLGIVPKLMDRTVSFHFRVEREGLFEPSRGHGMRVCCSVGSCVLLGALRRGCVHGTSRNGQRAQQKQCSGGRLRGAGCPVDAAHIGWMFGPSSSGGKVVVFAALGVHNVRHGTALVCTGFALWPLWGQLS